jgi:hypothetical protein
VRRIILVLAVMGTSLALGAGVIVNLTALLIGPSRAWKRIPGGWGREACLKRPLRGPKVWGMAG